MGMLAKRNFSRKEICEDHCAEMGPVIPKHRPWVEFLLSSDEQAGGRKCALRSRGNCWTFKDQNE